MDQGCGVCHEELLEQFQSSHHSHGCVSVLCVWVVLKDALDHLLMLSH